MSQCLYCLSEVARGVVFCCQSCELLSKWITNGELPLKSAVKVAPPAVKWQKFNESALSHAFNLSGCPVFRKFRFYVEGLQCSSCVHLLEDFPSFCEDVISARLNFSTGIFDVETKNTLGLGSLCEFIEQLGYTPVPLKENSDLEAARKAENKSDLKRIGVAGALAGNLMLLTVPGYAGLTGPLGVVFQWLAFLVFLPVLFYVGLPFYRKAYTSLLVRRINVDMMIVVALWAGFASSTYGLILGTDNLYFDSTASFIFLILLTRYLLKHHQNRILNSQNIFAGLFEKEIYQVGNERLTFDKIKENQNLHLQQNQLLPCDSVLSSTVADFDVSFLTGEAYPQKKHQNDRVAAGSRLLSPGARLMTTGSPEVSELAFALGKVELAKPGQNKLQTLADLFSHRLTLAVFAIAALFFSLTYHELGFEAFRRCLALITIACPCAVAFAAPLAQNLGLRAAAKEGFFLKSAEVFEKLGKIRKVIFDKTGTLTSSQLKLVKTFPPDISPENKALILGLEKHSLHPVALSLKSTWGDTETENIPDVTENPGQGVSAEYKGHQYSLTKAGGFDQNVNTMQADFSIDGRKIAYLYFEESLQPEANAVVEGFRHKEFDVMMLTGDRRTRALEVSRKIGIRPSFVFAEQSSESKKQLVTAQNPCLFVGDGLNDLPALHAAYVSFAIKGPFESTLQVSDVYAPKKNLHAVLEIFHLAKKIQSTVQMNLLFAVLYNSVGGILALSGYINPLAAAVLMPISSVLLTVHTVWRLG